MRLEAIGRAATAAGRGGTAMWTCRNCSARAEEAMEVCPRCGAVDLTVSAADHQPPASPRGINEASTEYEVHPLPDPGPNVVECHIGVTEEEASAVADRLRGLGIPAYICHDDPGGGGPAHRVRVPIEDLGRALAVVDLLHKQRTARP